MDDRKDPERTIRVVAELEAQLIGLQEVHSTFIQSTQLDTFSHTTGLSVIPGPTIHLKARIAIGPPYIA